MVLRAINSLSYLRGNTTTIVGRLSIDSFHSRRPAVCAQLKRDIPNMFRYVYRDPVGDVSKVGMAPEFDDKNLLRKFGAGDEARTRNFQLGKLNRFGGKLPSRRDGQGVHCLKRISATLWSIGQYRLR